MSYSIDVRLLNETADDVEVVIPEGTVFEGVQVTGLLMQNLSIEREYRVVLGPRVELTLHMKGRCINPHLAAPRGWVMRPTVFVTV